MAATRLSLRLILSELDPRRSLMAATMWLVAAMAVCFALAASYWAGSVAQEIVVEQHMRRLALETDQLGSDVGQAVSSRLQAVRALAPTGPLKDLYAKLATAYPDLGWIAVTDEAGTVIGGSGADVGRSVAGAPWLAAGLAAPWIGRISEAGEITDGALLGDIAIPVRDTAGARGVVAAHLRWRWAVDEVKRLSQSLDARGTAETFVLNEDGLVLVGPAPWLGRRWPDQVRERPVDAPHFETLSSGVYLVARAPVPLSENLPAVPWRVQLAEPKSAAYQRASALGLRIVQISVTLALITAVGGALAAMRLTHRLKQLTRLAAAAGGDQNAPFTVPTGADEVAQLGQAFAQVLKDLRVEREELLALSGDLERRVAQRTREVERLAEESRYSAVVRERLKIARDLHDTLAHSMMAMLSEVRILRKLQAHDPGALAEELERAEQVAHEGLIEARNAISQMRVNAVRDTGLGNALKRAFDRFIDRTGLNGEFSADPEAARFGDERAETLYRMAEEILRNIERHAAASRVRVELRAVADSSIELTVADNGVGFDAQATHQGHYGLVGLAEQALLIGATLEIESASGRGTSVRLKLRMAPEVMSS